jgi:hypothetical protein
MSVLTVSLDSSQLSPEERKQQKVKVAILAADGKLQSRVVSVEKERTDVRFEVDERATLDVAVGPDEAADEELHKLQTLTARVTPGRFELPLAITPFFWRFWLTWCRRITITGRVVCPDGRPAPGARVTAYDVDFVWWWWSRQQAGPAAITDANGQFTITFRWCCGWLPIWWWRWRYWALEPVLASRILSVLRLDDRRRPPTPDPVPDLRVFSGLLGQGRPLPSPRRSFDPSELTKLREPLLARLPRLPELERLRLWPWFPWTPWLDCTPDIIFRATQNCDGVEKTIVGETVFDTRWDVPDHLFVTLVANDEACCTPPPPPPGDCIVLTHACDTLVTDIEQDPANPLVGLANPGDAADDSDQPFAGTVTMRGQFGDGAHVDYYEIEHTQTPAVPASWTPIPPETAGGFTRSYLDIDMVGPVVTAQHFPINFATIDGVNVAESLQHFEAGHPPPAGVLRVPVGGQDTLVNLLTEDNFGDGVYYFRVMGYALDAGGHLINGHVLPLCNTAIENVIALRFDNRFVDNTPPFTSPPSSPTQPCGPGTVHTCTEEPDTRILAVRYNGVEVPPCGVVDTHAGGPLDIDFMVYDPDGFLHSYALVAKYSESLEVDLLATPGHTLTPVSLAGPPPMADHVGPTYRLAVPAGGMPPTFTWRGGEITLHIPDVRDAFPVTCAYVLQLDAFKRTIADCNYNHPYWNRSHYALTVQA